MIDFKIEKIAPLCEKFGVIIDEKIAERLNRYGNLLLEWNEKINLTAITEPEAVLYKHFYDCILFFKVCRLEKGSSIIDVGTGAGFPGMVLKIVRPDLKVTLLDSLNKRLVFLNEVINVLGLEGIETVHMRAEDAGKSKIHRENYDVATARAVASLPVLLEYCTPLVKKDGIFLSMKGPSAREELSLCENAIKVLNLSEPNIICETLTGDEQRAFITFKKLSQTPPKYPRKPSDISKQPL